MTGVKRGTGEQTWAGAARGLWRSALRHKVVSVLVALGVAGSLAAVGLASSASGQPARQAHPAAPAFALPLLAQPAQSGSVSLGGYRGRPLIVNFFASWCDPCQKETPLLARFYRTEHGKVAIVGLDENDVRASAASFTRAQGVGYPVGFDPAAIAATAYGVTALPQTFFLDAGHHIVDRVFGAVTLADLSKGIALATAKG